MTCILERDLAQIPSPTSFASLSKSLSHPDAQFSNLGKEHSYGGFAEIKNNLGKRIGTKLAVSE